MGLVNKLLSSITDTEEEVVQAGTSAETTETAQAQSNQAAVEEVEEELGEEEEEATYLDAASRALGQGEKPLPPPGAELAVLMGLLVTVPNDADRDYAAQILRSLSEDQRQQFVDAMGGQLHANLEAAYARDDASWIPEAAPNTGVQLPGPGTWRDMAQAALDAGQDLLAGNGIDLNALQVVNGGDLGGLVLDKNAPNDLQLDLDASDGRVTAKIPMLGIDAISTSVGGLTITSGGGQLMGLEISMDGNTSAQGADNEVKLSAAMMSLSDIGVATASNALTTIGALSMVGLSGSLTKTDKAGSLDPSALAMQVKDEMVDWGRELLKATAGLGSGAQGGVTAAQTILDNFSGTSDMKLNVGTLRVEDLLSGTGTTDAQGNSVVDTNQDHVRVDGFDVAALEIVVNQQDTMTVLGKEANRLSRAEKDGTLSASQAERLAWIRGELKRLSGNLREYTRLASLVDAGTALSATEHDRWVELERDFTTGVAEIKLGLVSVRGAHRRETDDEGQVTESDLADTMAGDLHVAVTSAELGGLGAEGVHNEGLTRLESLDRRLELAPAEREGNVLDGTYIDGKLGYVEAEGLSSRGASSSGLGAAEAEGLALEASGDAADVQVLRAGFDDLFSGGNSVRAGDVGGVDISARGDDVGGYVDHGSVEGVHVQGEGYEVDLESGSIDGVRADANVRTDDDLMPTDVQVRSASVEHGAIDGLTSSGAGSDGSTWRGDVGAAELNGLSVEDAALEVADPAGATGTVQLDGASAGAVYLESRSTGEHARTSSAQVGTASIEHVDVVRTEDGTTIEVQEAGAKDVLVGDTDYDVVAALDAVEASGTTVQLDGDDGISAAEVDRVGLEGLDATLWRLPMDMAMSSEESAEVVEKGPTDASALATANGVVDVDIPMNAFGLETVHLTVPVQDGFVDLGAIVIDATRNPDAALGGLAAALTDGLGRSVIYVRDGGLYVHLGPVRLFGGAMMSSTDYAGLESGGQTSRKGGVHIAPFIESMADGMTAELQREQADLERNPERLQARRERQAERQEAREARQAERAARRAERRGEPLEEAEVEEDLETVEEDGTVQDFIDETLDAKEAEYSDRMSIRGIQVDTSGLQIGSGSVGYGTNTAQLDGVEDFDLSFQVGGDLQGGFQRIAASEIETDLGVDIDALGFGGVDVTVPDWLGEDREISATVQDGEIVGLRYNAPPTKG